MIFVLHAESGSGVVCDTWAELEAMDDGCCTPCSFLQYREAREAGWEVEWLDEWDLI